MVCIYTQATVYVVYMLYMLLGKSRISTRGCPIETELVNVINNNVTAKKGMIS